MVQVVADEAIRVSIPGHGTWLAPELRTETGVILLFDHVETVTQPLGRGQAAVAWEVIGPVTVEGKGWRALVVGTRATGCREPSARAA